MKHTPEIAFYRNGGAQKVLARYDFSDTEKEIVQAAMVAARKERPDMRTIQKADALLRMVASTRKPLSREEDQTELTKSLAKAEAEYSSKGAGIKMGRDNREGNRILFFVAGMAVIGFLTIQFTKSYQADWYVTDHGMHSKAEAQKICKEYNDILPTIAQMNEVYAESNIFTHISDYFADKHYWVSDGGTLKIYRQNDDIAVDASSGDLAEVRCLDNANSVYN